VERVDLAGMRREYASTPLDVGDLDPDPMVAFRSWLDAVLATGADDANAMVLATADASGVPSARTVLLKGVDDRGFVFFTSTVSRKAAEMATNPRVAVTFRWRALERQVTVGGPIERVATDEADRYFATRPRASQIGAWASQQSEVIPNRAALEASAAAVEARFAGTDVPRPPFWGGYRVVPLTVEFWQGRPNRLHDRIRYLRPSIADRWVVERLSP
jgi:pyridoxamine 5'-phosphate oxidase